MPRIAYLVSQYPAVNHTYILREVRGLRALGFDIEVVSIRRPSGVLTAVEREEAAATFCVQATGLSGLLRAHLATALRHPIRYISGLATAARLAGPDLRRLFFHAAYFAQAVIAGHRMQTRGYRHLHSHFSSTVALLISHVFPITWSATIHGPAEFVEPESFHLKEKCRSARFLIAISDFGRSQLMRWADFKDWEKFRVCRLGVNLDDFPTRTLRTNPAAFELLCVAQLAPVKGHHVLISAVGLLRAQGRNIRLRLVGDGPCRADLEKQADEAGLNDCVVFEGALNQDRLLPIYQNTDVFVLASFAEGIPVVLMEAMSMEIPCVATWITGVPELIRNGVDGLLVPPSDPNVLTQAIASLMDDPTLRSQQGASARARIRTEYNLPINISKLADIFKKQLSD